MRKQRLKSPDRGWDTDDDLNPMENVANLVDVMLVFACGLMMAIVAFWNIDLDKINDVNQDSAYESIGQVYEDPETGKIYIIKAGE